MPQRAMSKWARGLAQHGRAVGGMHEDVGMLGLDRAAPSSRRRSSCALEEALVLEYVRGREVCHHPGQSHTGRGIGRSDDPRGLGAIARAEAAHAGVELDVDPRDAETSAAASDASTTVRSRHTTMSAASSIARSISARSASAPMISTALRCRPSRSSDASSTVATASHAAPAAGRRRRTRRRRGRSRRP